MGFEPTTSGATNQRSNQLSYNHHKYWIAKLADWYQITNILTQILTVER